MPSVRTRWNEKLSSSSPPPPPPEFVSPVSSSSSSSVLYSESTKSSTSDYDIAVPISLSAAATAAAEEEEEEIVGNLKHPQISIRELAIAHLRHSSRESSERRISLCTQKLLSSLLPFLQSRNLLLQANAVASIVNLSIEPANKIKIVRSGAVPPLVDVLKNGDADSRDNAAGAIFSLALEDDNRLAIGVLGALPPLLRLFHHGPASHRARKEAGMAIYYLTLAVNNAAKLAKMSGAARAVLRIATGKGGREAAELRRVAMMIMGNMAGRAEGRVALVDAGAVGTLVGMMKQGAGKEEEHCIGILYWLSRGSLRFRALAKAAGAEEALMKVDVNGEIGKEMVRRVLKVVRGEEVRRRVMDILADDDDDGEVDTVVFRSRYEDFGSSSGSH